MGRLRDSWSPSYPWIFAYNSLILLLADVEKIHGWGWANSITYITIWLGALTSRPSMGVRMIK